MFKLVFALLLAGAATAAFSALIDRLYSRETKELSFPDRLKERAVFRRPLLFVGSAMTFFCFDTSYPAASFFSLCFYLPLLIISVTDWEQYIIFSPCGPSRLPLWGFRFPSWGNSLLRHRALPSAIQDAAKRTSIAEELCRYLHSRLRSDSSPAMRSSATDGPNGEVAAS